MADVNPQIIFHLSLTDREYHVVMLGLSVIAGGKPTIGSESRQRAAELNHKLLEREQHTLKERTVAVDRKMGIATELLAAVSAEEPS